MSLHVYKDLEQRSDEWYELRRGIVTASTVGQLITAKTVRPASNAESRALTYKLAAERITGRVEPSFQSDAMLRGHMDEPIARQAYADWAGVEVAEVGFIVRELMSGIRIGYSPDGVVDDDGLIEIKSRDPKKHLQTIFEDLVPAENMAQLQCALWVTGRAWIDYVSYCAGMHLWVKRVEPDAAWENAIEDAVTESDKAIAAMLLGYATATADMPATEYVNHFPERDIF